MVYSELPSAAFRHSPRADNLRSDARPTCSIVIRSFNEADHIGKLLFGLRQQDYPIAEIILVDSGSEDDTVAIARSYGVEVVPISREEFSFGRALNLGCQHARGDVLVFVSAHVYPVHRSWLGRLIAPLSKDRCVLSYGRQIGNEVSKFSEHQIFAKWFPEESSFPQGHHFCNNANCAIRRTAWQSHPYDETLTGLEDLAWAKEVQRRGGLIAYVADAPIVHVHNESFERIRNRYRREAIAMRSIQPNMKFSFFDFLHLVVGNTLSDFSAALRQGRLIEELRSILLFRFNQFYGTWQGHRGPCTITSDLRRRFYFPQWRDDATRATHVQDDDLIDYQHTAAAATDHDDSRSMHG
jgi:glycosyltransferase involved in cell wall biosynthesis